MSLTLSPVLADRFTRIMAMLCAIIAEHGARRRGKDPLFRLRMGKPISEF